MCVFLFFIWKSNIVRNFFFLRDKWLCPSSWAALLNGTCFLNFSEYNETDFYPSSTASKKWDSYGHISEDASVQLFWNEPSSYATKIYQGQELVCICASTYHLPSYPEAASESKFTMKFQESHTMVFPSNIGRMSTSHTLPTHSEENKQEFKFFLKGQANSDSFFLPLPAVKDLTNIREHNPSNAKHFGNSLLYY